MVEICRRLDGIPLAIELAASRMASMTAGEVRDRLDQRFRLLVGSRRGLERHHTLRHAVAWSYDHLDDAEKTLLERSSVFAGGFDLRLDHPATARDVLQSHLPARCLAGEPAEADCEIVARPVLPLAAPHIRELVRGSGNQAHRHRGAHGPPRRQDDVDCVRPSDQYRRPRGQHGRARRVGDRADAELQRKCCPATRLSAHLPRPRKVVPALSSSPRTRVMP